MEELFPAVARFSAHARVKGVSDPDYFARYFAQGIPPDDVSDTALAALMDDADARGANSDLTTFLTTGKHSRTDLTLRKMAMWTAGESQPSRLITLGLFEAVLAARHSLDTNGLFSPRDRAISWLGVAARQLAPDVGASPLLAALTSEADLATALEVVWAAAKMDAHTNAPAPREVLTVAERLAEQAVHELLTGLRRRDDDDQEIPYHFHLLFGVKYGNTADIRAQLLDLFSTTEVTVEDFAARCVTIATIMAAAPIRRLHGFDRSSFSLLIPADDPFYHLPLQEGVDTKDLAWANRRFYSRGRLSSDVIDDRIADTDPASSDAKTGHGGCCTAHADPIASNRPGEFVLHG